MADKIEISNELKELGSSLAAGIPAASYQVPDGYFDNLAATVLSRVHALEADSPAEELLMLSPLLGEISKTLPYSVPAGYFDRVEERLQSVFETPTADIVDASEELASLSPLLSGLRSKETFTVPGGYFDQLQPAIPAAVKEPAKVVPLFRKNWIRYAAAAIVVAFLATIALVYRSKPDNLDPATTSFAWVEKNLDKVSTDDISSFVEQVNAENGDLVSSDTKVEISNLLKDVSDKEITEFLMDTQAGDANADDDSILN